ncbi:MAG: hypothetical protein IJU60_04935 [Acholeplasmatales bacterium]|nr:hypothetical protein [Acholeplasmatales bacterium]
MENDTKLAITPGDKEETVVLNVKVVVKQGDEVVASKTYVKEFLTRKMTDEEKVLSDVKAVRVAANVQNNKKDAYYYVVTYDLTGTEAKDLVFAGNSGAALYIASISVE